jgi:light-harvesting complex I chlorophyll a/b binding protein 2
VGIASSTAGGIFDPAGFSKGDMASLKLKEIKNARLAMLVRLATGGCSTGMTRQLRRESTLLTYDCANLQAYAGFLAQHVVTDTTPIGNLRAHLENPWRASLISPSPSHNPLP